MKPLRTAVALLTVLALPSFGLTPRLAAEDFDETTLYKKVLKSCVFIVTPVKGGYGMGSGSLIDAERRYVLTNYHVVEDQDAVFCQFPVFLKDGSVLGDKKEYMKRIPAGQAIKGKVLFRDISRDLALVQLASVPTGTPAIPLSRKSPEPATRTWNIGSPGDLNQVFGVTEGRVRQVGPENMVVGGGGESFTVKATMVKATNPTNPGDSGGPLFDKRGYLVAVTESGSRKAQAMNYFVDVSEVRALLSEKKIQIKEPDDGDKPETKKGTTPTITPKKDGGTETGGTPPKKDDTVVTPKGNDTPAPSPADERAAADKLRSARLFAMGEDNRPTYIAKLTEIVKKWPNTDAGKQAKKLLDGLK